MTRPFSAIFLAVVCATIAGVIAWHWIVRHQRSRLALAQADMVSYGVGLAGAVSLVPEMLQAFAPELLGGVRLSHFGAEDVDYLAYIFAPISVGIGLVRRWQLILLEREIAARAAPPS